MTPFSIDAGPLAAAYARQLVQLEQLQFADALWSRRVDVWSTDVAVQKIVANRLGWLDAIEFLTTHLDRIRSFAGDVRREHFSHIVLLGMGGSSLAPEVLRQVLGVAPGFPAFRMLDSVDPDAVRAAFDSADSSLFVMASKSGGTIEPNSMAAEAQRLLKGSGQTAWGQRFVAITDQGTAFHQRAQAEGFREIFVNPTDIGGRYSALSFFGMVPAALMGADLERLLVDARVMEAACRSTTVATNPGLALGALIAAGAALGRDKLTLLLPKRLASFGLWVEQLVAESTGKGGKGIVPITGEAADADFGSDRVIVAITLGGQEPDAVVMDRARASGAPMASLQMSDEYGIGAEFLRWEIATATAGVLLGINPFDEPNVQQAKDATRVLLQTYQQRGALPVPEAHASIDGVRLTLSNAAGQALEGRQPSAFLSLVGAGDYVGLLAYLPPDVPPFVEPLHAARTAIGDATKAATMFGYGPRYLHSTGQLHKGGANNGVFIVIAAPAAEDLPIPGEPFTFGVLEMAQAIGDFQSLDGTGRRALLVQLPRRDPAILDALVARLVKDAADTTP